MPDSYFTIYNVEAFATAPSGGATTQDMINTAEADAHQFGNGVDPIDVDVRSGAALTGNTATIHIVDGPDSAGAGPDTDLNDSGDTDQVLGSTLTFPGSSGGDSYAPGLFVQMEAQQLVTYSDGTTGRAVWVQVTNQSTSADTSTGGYLFFEDTPGGNIAPRTLVAGETLTFTTRDGESNLPYSSVVCFEAGTLIDTPDGPVAAGRIKAGDRVITVDDGAQRVLWVGHTSVLTRDKLHPVEIRAGALGGGLPRRRLLVSRQHRVLCAGGLVQDQTGAAEVLVPAIKLVGLPGIALQDHVRPLTYVHVLTDRHQLVMANGAPCETLYLGEMAKSVLPMHHRRAIANTLRGRARLSTRPARPILSNGAAKALARGLRVAGTAPLGTGGAWRPRAHQMDAA